MRKKTVTISLVTTPELAAKLRSTSIDMERSVSWIIGKAIEQYFGIGESDGKPKAPPQKKSVR